jgi:hypothetical protein
MRPVRQRGKDGLLSVLKQRFSIPTREFAEFALDTMLPDGIFVVDLEVVQQPGRADDVGFMVMDQENLKLWKYNQQAMKAGATATALPRPRSMISAMLSHGAFAFRPPQAGSYYCILDNTYSVLTPKVVDVSASWMWFEDARFRFIERVLKAQKWDDIWALMKSAEGSLDGGKTIDCCNALRMSLMSVWAKVCEVVTGEKVSLDKGKTPDVGILANYLTQRGVSEQSIAVIRRVWSYISELAHVEKAEARPPSTADTSFAFGLTVPCILYLLRLIPSPAEA